MKYWLYITTLDNWTISNTEKIIGFSEKNAKLTTKISKGDKGIFYIKCYGGSEKIKDPIVLASFSIDTDFYFDNQELFTTPKNMISQKFPYRYKINNVKIFKQQVKMKNLVNNLTFFKNKKRWGTHLMGRVMVELNKDDFNYIVNSSDKGY